MANRVDVVLHLFIYRSWMMLILLWKRKFSRLRKSVEEVKIKVCQELSCAICQNRL